MRYGDEFRYHRPETRQRPIRYLGFPWQMVRWLFSPRYTIIQNDPTVERLNWARLVVGVLSTSALVRLWDSSLNLEPSGDAPVVRIFDDSFTVASLRPYLLIVSAFVGCLTLMILLTATTEPERRAATWTQMRYSRFALAGFLLLVVAGVLAYRFIEW